MLFGGGGEKTAAKNSSARQGIENIISYLLRGKYEPQS